MNFTIENNKLIAHTGTEKAGEICFTLHDDVLTIETVIAEPSQKGTGVGRILMQGIVEHVQANNYRVTLSCPYAVKVFADTPAYLELLRPSEACKSK